MTKPKKTEADFEMYVAIPDLHIPYEDKESVKTVMHFLKDVQPDHVVLIGDVVDMYSVSRFDKDPKRANRLQEELDATKEFLRALRDTVGDAEITYLEGNHEQRVMKYLRRYPEMADLRSLKIPAMLELDDLGIDYREDLIVNDNFLFTHGEKIAVHATKAELSHSGMSGMSGHTHHCQMYSNTDRKGVAAWYSIGHLCDVDQAEYTRLPNWQEGIGVVYFEKKSGRFFATVVHIVNHKFIFSGKMFTPNGVQKLG